MKAQFALLKKHLPVVFAVVGLYGVLCISHDGVRIDAAPNSEPIFPDFAMATVSGGTWRFSEERGHVVLLNFWATWCPPCRAETPDLIRLSQEFKQKGLVVAGIVVDTSDKSAIQDFVARYQVPYSILLPKPDSAMVEAVDLLPTTILFDANGRRIKTYSGQLPIGVARTDILRVLSGNKSKS